ncbi:MAG: hypothetical protein J0M34_08720 [Alphaproteobacteria bacterium]|nr:hypothetical protein [Alphaproteobacteria bacterium]
MVTLSEVRFDQNGIRDLNRERDEALSGRHAEGALARIPIIGGLLQYVDVDFYARDRDSGFGIGGNTRGIQNLGVGDPIGNMRDALGDIAREARETFLESQVYDPNGIMLNLSQQDRAQLAAEYMLPIIATLNRAGRQEDAQELVRSMQAQGFTTIEADILAIEAANVAAQEARALEREERQRGEDLRRARGASMRDPDADAIVTIAANGTMTSTNLGTTEAPADLTATSSLQDQVTALLTARTITVVSADGTSRDASGNVARATELVRVLARGGDPAALTGVLQALNNPDDDDLARNASNLLRSLTPEEIRAAVPDDINNFAAIEEALIRTQEELRREVRENRNRSAGGDNGAGIFQALAAFFITAFVQDPAERERILNSMFPDRDAPEAGAESPAPDAPPAATPGSDIVATITPNATNPDQDTVVFAGGGITAAETSAARELYHALNEPDVTAQDRETVARALREHPRLANMKVSIGGGNNPPIPLEQFLQQNMGTVNGVNAFDAQLQAAFDDAQRRAAPPAPEAPDTLAGPPDGPPVGGAQTAADIMSSPELTALLRQTFIAEGKQAEYDAISAQIRELQQAGGVAGGAPALQRLFNESLVRQYETSHAGQAGVTANSRLDLAELNRMVDSMRSPEGGFSADEAAAISNFDRVATQWNAEAGNRFQATSTTPAPSTSVPNPSLVAFEAAFISGAPIGSDTANQVLDRLFNTYDNRKLDGTSGADRILDQQELSRLAADVIGDNNSRAYGNDLAFRTLLAANDIDPAKVGLQWQGDAQTGHFVEAPPPAADARILIARDVAAR